MIIINSKKFSSQKKLKMYVQDMIQSKVLDQTFLHELLCHHRTRKKDLFDEHKNPRKLYLQWFRQNYGLYLYGNEDPISRKHCILMASMRANSKSEEDFQNKLIKMDIENCMKTLREEIRNNGCTYTEFRRQFDDMHYINCTICGDDTTGIGFQIDHVVPFVKIVKDFLKLNDMTKYDLADMKIVKAKRDWGGTVYEFKSRAFAYDFVKYHDEIATYQVVCQGCNLKKGGMGYKL